MSGSGKRRLSLETLEEPSTKRQRLERSDATGEAFTNGQDNSASYPTYMTQPQPVYHPSATLSQHVFHPPATPAQDVFQPQNLFQPEHGFQPQHEFQPQPVPRSQPILQPHPISGANVSSQRPEDEATDTDSGSEDDNEPEEAGPSIPSQGKGKRRASSPAPEEPNAKKGPSARSQRRAGMKNPGRDDRERDEVEEIEGQLYWRDPKTGELRKAVYHNDIRAELIAAASALGAYTHQRKRGTRAHDETAFHPEQRDWTPERQNWPRIRDNVLNIHNKAGYKGKYYRKPVERIWEHTDGRVILDKDNHPVRRIPDLPATLSSEVEGWYLEVLTRLDNRILRRDFWARLPHGRDKTGSKPASEDMYGLSALGNRRGRWRTSEGLIPWKSRGGSKELNDFLRSTISQESLDRNSNEGGRTLTPEEAKHAEAISKGKKDQKAKSRGRKPASTPSSTEKGVSVSTEPQSSPGQTLPNGYPDPSSPSLVRHPRPLSTLLVGIERAQEENRQREEERAREEERVREEEKFENPLANGGIHASNTFEHSLDASQDDQNPFQPSGTMDWGAGTSGAFFDNNVPGFGPITYGDAQGHDYQGWDEVQEQLWASLSNEIWDFTGSNTVGPTGGIGQDGGDNIPINQNGHHEWSQPGHSDAVQDATQTQHQIHQIQQQRQGVFDQVDNHAGQNGSPAQLDWSTSQMIDQQRSANSVGNLQSQLNHTNQFVPPTQRVVAGTDLQQTADSGSTILQNSYCPVSNGDKHKRTADPKAATEFAARQTAKDDFRGRVEQAPQSATKANDLGLPPLIDLTGDSPELEAHRHPDFRTAMSNSQQLVEADEQAMRILQNTAPTSSYPTGHPTTDSSHPVSASTSLPVHDGIANQPSSPPTTTIPFSSPPTPTITPIEASLIPPTTRLHHAILWRLFKPTREAFKAAFRDDEWRPYVARNFVPTNTEPMSYMDMLDYYSGEFWKVWTARYGFQVEVPRLAGPTVIDEGVARALGDGGEGGGM